ncbi:hypothetical protein Trichorick_01637 (plasmid) [Candidatus Trichorickettsia mobilis]|uniref:hypothetical protein n=1 Tax=Candidatus Trichorickettsia mobilis TaxID=1346319 RepID=UPI002B25B8CA|nr:hypothetical protein [Candidatus Trichorickettsia mobilis]WPY01719.1 hypothetical protein Trichorick_01637 [Candidatus Trichorickettsia mobilis]
MSSKQLNSILNLLPSATAEGEKQQLVKQQAAFSPSNIAPNNKIFEDTERIVAVIPSTLKEEIKHYIKSHKGETERIVILKALKLMGFNVPNEWLIDKRTTR